jgi:hypothetical protein
MSGIQSADYDQSSDVLPVRDFLHRDERRRLAAPLSGSAALMSWSR